MTGYEVSAMYVSGLLKALKEHGLLEQVLAGVSPATRAVAAAPFKQRWHPGTVTEELSFAVPRLADAQRLEDVTYEMAKRSFGPIVTPMIKVAMALTGSSPATIFSRLQEATDVAVRGLDITWLPLGPTRGEVKVGYPWPIPAEVEPVWRGTLRFAFELARTDGRVEKATLTDRTVTLPVAW